MRPFSTLCDRDFIEGRKDMAGLWDTFAFLIFPYLCLTVCVLGNVYRHRADPYGWNARSSEIFEKRSLKVASNLFHYGVLLALAGHFMGLLVPQTVYDMFGINSRLHTGAAHIFGAAFGLPAFIGGVLLLWRRTTDPRVGAATTVGDLVTSILVLIVMGLGTYNVFFGDFHVLDTIAPWLRGILIFRPDTSLLADAPLLYKIHILAAFTLFGFSPFSRLVHIWSAPVSYIRRAYILFRTRCADPSGALK